MEIPAVIKGVDERTIDFSIGKFFVSLRWNSGGAFRTYPRWTPSIHVYPGELNFDFNYGDGIEVFLEKLANNDTKFILFLKLLNAISKRSKNHILANALESDAFLSSIIRELPRTVYLSLTHRSSPEYYYNGIKECIDEYDKAFDYPEVRRWCDKLRELRIRLLVRNLSIRKEKFGGL